MEDSKKKYFEVRKGGGKSIWLLACYDVDVLNGAHLNEEKEATPKKRIA